MASTLNKKYNIKIYGSDGVTFKQTLNPGILRNPPSFSSQLYKGLGECRLDLNLSFEDFGEGVYVDYMNIVEIYATDEINPKGRLIYKGFISSYEPFIQGADQGVSVILLGMISFLAFSYYKDGSSYTVSHSSEDTADIMRAIIDHFQSVYGAIITYDMVSTVNIGNSASYDFIDDKWLDALQNAFGTIGNNDYYWNIGRDGKLYVQPKPLTAVHTFTVGKDIESLRIRKNSEKIVNDVQLRYNNTTLDGEDLISTADYGKRTAILKDDRVTILSTAQQKVDQALLTNKDPKIQASIVVNSNYDIESIQPGDTCKVRNLKKGSITLDDNMLIVGVQYAWDRVTIQLSELDGKFGVELNNFINP